MLEKLNYLIDTEKIYLKPEISLDELAKMMNSNRQYLSILINHSFGKSFPIFIAEHRVEYAKSYWAEHLSAKVDDVAIASGFSRSETFIRNFKSFTGLSPYSWKRKFLE